VAVVKANGIPARASGLTSSFRADSGTYRVVSNLDIGDDCTTVATRGSVGTGVPFNPATVELTNGPAPNVVGIEVRELLLLGGGSTSQSFHLASVC
jgi:hypothetical protein